MGQLLIDLTKLTPARILTGYVVAGVVLSAVGLVRAAGRVCRCGGERAAAGLWASAGKGRAHRPCEKGAIGILTGGLTAASAGITASLVCGVVCSLVGKSHDQN